MRAQTLFFLVFALLAAPMPPATATTVCATNVAQINSALAQAATDTTGMTIRVAAGAYVLEGVGFSNASAPALHDLVLQGGYDKDCLTHTNGATSTKFTSNGETGLVLRAYGDLRLSDMSFQGLQGQSELALLGTESDDLILERAIFAYTNSAPLLLHMADGESGRISVQNVLVHGTSNIGGCVVSILGNSGTALIANTTIAHSTAAAGLCLNGQMEKRAYANIVWTAPMDVVNSGSDVLSVRNVYGQQLTGPMDQASTGDLTSDPAFVDPVNGDYGLASGSPAINSGGTFVPGGLATFDLDGGSRVKGSQVDRGAQESTMSDLLVYTVTKAGDGASVDGDPGTLRRAISDANAVGQPALIQFGMIPATCPRQINIDRALPQITVPMVIDGTTQNGSTVNTSLLAFDAHICVVIAASPSVPTVDQGLFVYNPVVPTAVTVRGLGFSGIVSPLIFYSGSGHRVVGNQFGGSLPTAGLPLALKPNGLSVAFSGTSKDSIMGGPDPIDRNVVAGESGFTVTSMGILLGGVGNHDTEVRNNLIGMDRDGLTAAPLGQGVAAVNGGHVIVDNRIGSCSTDAIRLAGADHVTVQNNDIGGSLPNGVGIIVNAGSSDNTIGAAAAQTGRGNRVTNNLGGAVWIDPTAGISNRVRDNQLTVNASLAGENAMVLDLGEQGPDANDDGDGDTGPNDLINYPVLGALTQAGNVISLVAKVDVPVGEYTLDVYAANSCLSSGRAMADRKLLTTHVSKTQMGQLNVPLTVPASGQNPAYLGATLTSDGGSTSELSNCLDVVDVIFADGFE